MELAYVDLEVPPGSLAMYKEVFHTHMGFWLDNNGFLRKPWSSNAEHFPRN